MANDGEEMADGNPAEIGLDPSRLASRGFELRLDGFTDSTAVYRNGRGVKLPVVFIERDMFEEWGRPEWIKISDF